MGRTAPHSFTFVLQMDIPLSEQVNLLLPPDRLDLLPVAKTYYVSSKRFNWDSLGRNGFQGWKWLRQGWRMRQGSQMVAIQAR